MEISLKGTSPAALVAGILLLSRARSFGIPGVRVQIVGDPDTITPVLGPAILHSNVLASCGVGREDGHGPLVIVPGAANLPLLASLSREGLGPWFQLDTQGGGCHPATQAFVRLARDRRPAARTRSRQLRRALATLGIPPEPALLDLLFDAPAPALTRLALALRAGRSMEGDSSQSWQRWGAHCQGTPPDPIDLPGGMVLERFAAGDLEPWLARLSLGARDRVEDWLVGMSELAEADGGRDHELVGALAQVVSQALLLPQGAMLPPPSGAEDLIATGLVRALGATRGEPDANQALLQVFRFLGGRFVEHAAYPVDLGANPEPQDRLSRWKWFVDSVQQAATLADSLWAGLMDPAS